MLGEIENNGGYSTLFQKAKYFLSLNAGFGESTEILGNETDETSINPEIPNCCEVLNNEMEETSTCPDGRNPGFHRLVPDMPIVLQIGGLYATHGNRV